MQYQKTQSTKKKNKSQKLILFTLLILSSFFSAQITWEKGSITNNQGISTEVLIKNYDWKKSPEIVEYKLNENDVIQKIKTSDLQEFSVDNLKYLNADVMIDRSASANNLSNISSSSSFDDKEETLLLKVLVEGDINLYEFFDGTVLRYFYKRKENFTIQQLHFKEYMKDSMYILKNEEYKKQLLKEFADNSEITAKDIDKLSYRENELVKIFKAYNHIVEEKGSKKDNFHVYIKPGIGFSNAKLESHQFLKNSSDDTNSLVYKIGVEFEYVFGFNKGKWSVFSDPSFQTTKSNLTTNINNYDYYISIKYAGLQIPLGVKYRVFFNKKSSLFFSASFGYDFSLNKDTYTVSEKMIALNYIDNVEDYKAAFVRVLKVGYNYDRFGIEASYGNIPNFNIKFIPTTYELFPQGFGLSLSYKIF